MTMFAFRLRPSVTVRLRSNTAPQTARKVTQMQADTKRQPANVFMESGTLYFYCRDFADYREGTQAAKRIRPHGFLSEEDLWGGSKGVINFPWIFFFFFAMQSLVPVGHFRNISGHLFTWLVCGSFQWCYELLFTDCIVWDDKDKVVGFKRSYWIHLGWWRTGSPKPQLFQLSQHSHVTNCRLISSSAYFP